MKRVVRDAAVLGALGAALLLGQNSSAFDQWWTPENDALVAARQHHKLLFENDEVRVLKVTRSAGRSRTAACSPVSKRSVLHLRVPT
jgi:hypothetical protein